VQEIFQRGGLADVCEGLGYVGARLYCMEGTPLADVIREEYRTFRRNEDRENKECLACLKLERAARNRGT
jgi:hypothetical protein